MLTNRKKIKMSAIYLNTKDQESMQLMRDMEIEMMSDLYNRMTNACHKKCIPPRYHEAELGKYK